MLESTADFAYRVERARELFFEGRPVPQHWVPPSVLRSWQRSRELGLLTSDKALFNPVTRADQLHVADRCQQLMHYAMPELEKLYAALAPADWILACLDEQGMVVKALGENRTACRPLGTAFRTGVGLGERVAGTTAPGCALIERAPIVINANEHFLEEARVFSCTAVPLFGPAGELIGALDASCRYRGRPLGLLECLAITGRSVENRIVLDLPGATHIAIHYRPDLLTTPLEALLAFSDEGQLLGANQAARQLLALLPGQPLPDFASLFDLPFERALNLLTRARSTPLALESRAGLRVHARLAKSQSKDFVRGYNTDNSTTSRPPGDSLYADPALSSILASAQRAHARGLPVLINGETGTGKEVLARHLHQNGPRRDGPFVAINCSSIPAGLIESELFGYEEGAFTGSRRGGAAGKFEQAQGGTLLLDEIGDMPLELQGRLLRVLQERAVTRVGGARTIPIDVAVICATHHDLKARVADRSFREDLYYRVNGLRVVLPPLRERNDLNELIVELLRAEYGNETPPSIAEEAMALLQGYDWPGNIRQLAHIVRLACVLAEDEHVIGPQHLPEELHATSRPVAANISPLERAECSAIQAALRQHGGNISRTARHLGLARATLYRKMKGFGI